MRIGLRSILLIVAIVLFVVAMIREGNASDMIALGLAVFAGSFLVGDLGVGGRFRGRL